MIEVKNSSGKISGTIMKNEQGYIITNNNKPELLITDKDVIQAIENKNVDIIVYLYDELQLTIGEIAALYNVCYSNMNRKIKTLPITTNASTGRRNSSYGQIFSQQRKDNISNGGKGKHNRKPYKMTEEIKKKISNSLKKYYSTHEVSQETRQKLSQAWVDGKYENSSMGRGINGYFFSIKNNKQFFFRSLLELYYCLFLEENERVINYNLEPFQIPIDKIHHYTPDILINNSYLIELKSYKYVKNVENQERFIKEQEAAKTYCASHNLEYEVVYDKDIDFDTRNFKRYLKANPDVISKYHISFVKEDSLEKWS